MGRTSCRCASETSTGSARSSASFTSTPPSSTRSTCSRTSRFPLVEHTKLAKSEIRQRVVDKLRILDLDESVLLKYPAELSGGMRKRVGLARALMLEPHIIVYDEPTSGLDPITSRAVDGLIEQTRRRFNVTSLVITHDIASCFILADQAIVLDKGQIVARGTPQELAHGDNQVARDFIRLSGVDVKAIASRPAV